MTGRSDPGLRARTVAALVLLFCAGCRSSGLGAIRTGPPPPAALQAQAARDLGCPADALVARHVGRGEHRVEGCGAWIRYSCITRRDEGSCEWIDRGALGVRSTWGDDVVGPTRVRVHDQLAACLPPGREGTEITVVLTPDGLVRRRSAGDESSACIDRALAPERLPGRAERERVVTWVISAVAPDAAEEDPAPAAPPGERARGVVTALGAHVLRCTGGQPITLQLSWTSEGALDALVISGAGPGVESCIRSIVRRGRIAPTGRSGFVTHTVAP